jgi:hypothetical protein
MRTYKAELGALQLELAVNFRAGREITEKVADPMFVLRETQAVQGAEKVGMRYQSKFAWGMENIPLAIWIGAKETQPALKLSEVQEACIEIGLVDAMQIADEFLVQFITPKSKEPLETKGESAPGE